MKKIHIILLISMSFILLSCNDNNDDINDFSRNNRIEAVDLGLSVKWASANLGASNPWDIGYLYHWGETEPSNNNTVENESSNKDEENPQHIDKDISGTEYDAARHLLGGKWRMPTEDEAYELFTLCDFQASQLEGVEGTLITGPSGKNIFVPNYVFFLGSYSGSPNIALSVDIGEYYWGEYRPGICEMLLTQKAPIRAVMEK